MLGWTVSRLFGLQPEQVLGALLERERDFAILAGRLVIHDLVNRRRHRPPHLTISHRRVALGIQYNPGDRLAPAGNIQQRLIQLLNHFALFHALSLGLVNWRGRPTSRIDQPAAGRRPGARRSHPRTRSGATHRYTGARCPASTRAACFWDADPTSNGFRAEALVGQLGDDLEPVDAEP